MLLAHLIPEEAILQSDDSSTESRDKAGASPQMPAITAVFLAEASLVLQRPVSGRGKLIARLLKKGPLNLEVNDHLCHILLHTAIHVHICVLYRARLHKTTFPLVLPRYCCDESGLLNCLPSK